MSIHKLTAGDGYAYLTRQVAALDATDKQHTGLADYYSQRGESPGRWTGSALADVWSSAAWSFMNLWCTPRYLDVMGHVELG
jgi:TrwC relaxase